MLDRYLPRIDGAWQPATERIRPIDVAIAIGLAGLSLAALIGGAADVGPRSGVTAGLLLLQSLPLLARRRFPLEVFLIVVAATIAHVATLPQGAVLNAGLGVLVAFYTLGERLDRQASVPMALLAGTILGLLMISQGGFPAALQGVIQTELILGVALLVGDSSRIRRLYTAAIEDRARLVEQEREERTLRAVLEERQRIARELHDVVAHHVSVIVIQAGGASRAVDKRPADVRSALDAIAATGRQALTDMRRLVGSDAEGDAAPLPRLAELATLLQQVQSAGLAVDLSIEGEPRRLDPGLELSAYRIIQEGLTNSLKHAGNGRAVATVRYETDALEITIEDHRGRGPAPALEPAHDGRGLLGMRERVALFGGTFTAGPTATGFRVAARLPLDDPGPVS
jgi:signal transduction histidine kinase